MMKVKTKFIAVMLMIALCLVIVGCGADKNESVDSNPASDNLPQYPEEVNMVLDREIFLLKESSKNFADGIVNLDDIPAFTSNWKYRQLLNEEYFYDINWDVNETDPVNGVISIMFIGKNLQNDATVGIEFLYAESASEYPLATAFVYGDIIHSAQDFVDEGDDIKDGVLKNDILCATFLSKALLTSNDGGFVPTSQNQYLSADECLEQITGFWHYSSNSYLYFDENSFAAGSHPGSADSGEIKSILDCPDGSFDVIIYYPETFMFDELQPARETVINIKSSDGFTNKMIATDTDGSSFECTYVGTWENLEAAIGINY